ncbi:hypothetical protein HYU45_03830 [Candidatus Daviesbacteria bacterium]|nr:hypothetical protein [Candidatus Daviesbacteria bacterium]
MSLTPDRERLFEEILAQLHFQAEVYPLEDKFDRIPLSLSRIFVLDVTKVPGCHYGLRNVFVPIIKNLEEIRNKGRTRVTPDNAILVEPSTGNGWVAFSDAAEALGYEHLVVMPDGLPEARYKHPSGRLVKIIKTSKELYAKGMPLQLKSMLDSNPDRIKNGEKIYVSPNHAVAAHNLAASTMAELGKQLVDQLKPKRPLTVVASMGNGASICALGEYVMTHTALAKIIATESFAYGGGYDWFARQHPPFWRRYAEIFGFEPGNPVLLTGFKTWGTNAPIGIRLPLQARAIEGSLLSDYSLFTDNDVLAAYDKGPTTAMISMMEGVAPRLLPNYSNLPSCLIDTYGNSTLANIAVAERAQEPGRITVAMAYDSRNNY